MEVTNRQTLQTNRPYISLVSVIVHHVSFKNSKRLIDSHLGSNWSDEAGEAIICRAPFIQGSWREKPGHSQVTPVHPCWPGNAGNRWSKLQKSTR